jgi:hypothetical protein
VKVVEIITELLDQAEEYRAKEFELKHIVKEMEKSSTDEVAKSYLQKHVCHLKKSHPQIDFDKLLNCVESTGDKK